MATWYFDKSGSGGNSGMIGSPKVTANQAVALASAGDTIICTDAGVYVENLANVLPANSTLLAANLPILRPSLSGDNAIIQITSRTGITVDGFDLDGVNSNINATGCIWVTGTSSNLTFKNGKCRNILGGNGIMLQDQACTDILIQAMTITNNGDPASTLHHGIYVRASNVTVEDCLISGNAGYGIHQYSASWDVSGEVYRRNRIKSQQTRGVLLSHGNSQFYNNFVYQNARGIEVDSGTQVVLNNSIYANNHYAIWQYGGTNHTIKNNVGWQNLNDTLQQDAGTATTGNNLFGTDPKWVDPNNGDFRLRSDSPLIDAGADMSFYFTTDFYGNARV